MKFFLAFLTICIWTNVAFYLFLLGNLVFLSKAGPQQILVPVPTPYTRWRNKRTSPELCSIHTTKVFILSYVKKERFSTCKTYSFKFSFYRLKIHTTRNAWYCDSQITSTLNKTPDITSICPKTIQKNTSWCNHSVGFCLHFFVG